MARNTTVVTACRNREANLAIAIQTWLKARPQKIIICDWGSEHLLTHDSLGIPTESRNHVDIHRIEADRWILTWAFNEVLRSVSSKFTLKLDCDHIISEEFFEKNLIQSNCFARGHWRSQRSSQQYVNGAFLSCTELLQHVGFYDERITTYGWDDSDLYERLYESASTATTLSRCSIHHLDQDEEQRTSSQDISKEALLASFLAIKKSRFLIERNRILIRMLWPWNNKMFYDRLRIRKHFVGAHPKEEGLIEFATIRAFEQFYAQPGNDRYQPAIEAYHSVLSQDKDVKNYRTSAYLLASIINSYSKACHANDDWQKNILRLCLIAGSSSSTVAERRLKALERSQSVVEEHSQISSTLAPKSQLKYATKRNDPIAIQPKLYIDAQHGLGNRLRAIASAATIAKATDRQLVIIWQPDHHCQARFCDLFSNEAHVEEESFILNAHSMCDAIYNYMTSEPNSCKDKEINLSIKGSMYVRSAFALNSRAGSWESENAFLKSLKAHDFIQGLTSAIRHPNKLSVHVRMAGGKDYDHLPYESQSNWNPEDHKAIAEWRERSHYKKFFCKIDHLIASQEIHSIFVAADLPETYDEFRKRYGDRMTWLPRQINDRSAEQLQFALADAILLSRAELFLGSTWSSFSELALRLADPSIRYEMSGIDF